MTVCTEDRLKTAFKNGLNISEEVDYEKLEYAKTEGWDSVAHMVLISAIEDEFEIMIETDDVIAMSSFQVAKEILKKYEVEVD